MKKLQLCYCHGCVHSQSFSCRHDFIRENPRKQISSVCRRGSVNKNSKFRNCCSSNLRWSEKLVEICDIIDRKSVFKSCSKSFSNKRQIRVCRRCRSCSNSHVICFECRCDSCSWNQCSEFASKDQGNNIVTFPHGHLIQKRSFVVSKQFRNFLLCILQEFSAPVKKFSIVWNTHFFSEDLRKNFISCFRQFVVCRGVDCFVDCCCLHFFWLWKYYIVSQKLATAGREVDSVERSSSFNSPTETVQTALSIFNSISMNAVDAFVVKVCRDLL